MELINKMRKNRKGFTLVEIIVVLVDSGDFSGLYDLDDVGILSVMHECKAYIAEA